MSLSHVDYLPMPVRTTDSKIKEGFESMIQLGIESLPQIQISSERYRGIHNCCSTLTRLALYLRRTDEFWIGWIPALMISEIIRT